MKLNDINKVTCVGSGVIGYSFALLMSLKGLNTYVYDISIDALNLAKERVKMSLSPLIKNNVINESAAKEIEERIH